MNTKLQLKPILSSELAMNEQACLKKLKTPWELKVNESNEFEIFRTFSLPSYIQALELLTDIAKNADEINHHPDLTLGFKKLTVSWSTHDIGGLHDNDFICADMCDLLYAEHLKSGSAE